MREKQGEIKLGTMFKLKEALQEAHKQDHKKDHNDVDDALHELAQDVIQLYHTRSKQRDFCEESNQESKRQKH